MKDHGQDNCNIQLEIELPPSDVTNITSEISKILYIQGNTGCAMTITFVLRKTSE